MAKNYNRAIRILLLEFHILSRSVDRGPTGDIPGRNIVGHEGIFLLRPPSDCIMGAEPIA